MDQILIVLTLLFLGFVAGKYNEKRHYDSIRKRERATRSVELNNCRKFDLPNDSVLEQKLVVGSTVVSIDYFKLITVGIKSLFGGRLKTVESLVDRARREAVLRMKEEANDFSMIINIKIETSAISNDIARKRVGSIEVLAYGTAIKLNSSKGLASC